VLPGRDVEDDFVLPPKPGEKYLHFKEGNNITVVNYFSLDCPYCRRLFFEEKKLVEQYGGKVNFAFRDKPLSSNLLSYEKALIKECVYINNGNSDEKYFGFSEDVFLNYENKSNNLRNNEWVKTLALKYVSQEVLNDCLVDEMLKQKILGFRMAADASQIVWTPTIVVFKDGVEVERIEKVWAEIYRKVLERYTK
jgi:thiol-disulfide isomerase/thioredoxin